MSEDPRELPEPSDTNDDRGQPPSAAETEEVSPVNDQLDVSVHDTEVLAEIEMMTNLIIATSETDGPLTQARIDEILGVTESCPPRAPERRPPLTPARVFRARSCAARPRYPLALP